MSVVDVVKAYVRHLTGEENPVMDWRLIHDKIKGEPAKVIRGVVDDVYSFLKQENKKGYGVFLCVNAMDGKGYELSNVSFIRSHVVDLDDTLTSVPSFHKAMKSEMPPHFAVQTSENKFHLYWTVEPYTGNDFYTEHQKKLIQVYNGDKKITDASRVLRVPGFLHQKDSPTTVLFYPLTERPRYTFQQIKDALENVYVVQQQSGVRKPLGSEDMKAPSFEELKEALASIDPNTLDRDEWLSTTAAFKQSGWLIAPEETLFSVWSDWCSRYSRNDQGENLKLWKSVRDSEVGWKSLNYKTPIKPEKLFSEPQKEDFPEILSEQHCKTYFSGCYFVESTGEIFTPTGRFMNSTQFNGRYGGKDFVVRKTGKLTDEAWKAALRSSLWTIPKVDHTRFLPETEPLSIIRDDYNRAGLNTYIRPIIKRKKGDVSLWLKHLENILPDAKDRKILCDYMAHTVKHPGCKIKWAIMLQSCEGAGKSVFAEVLSHALGSAYVYKPKSQELITSGSKFNAWMRNKLCIIVDEIKIDERRELIEILKPMITEPKIEVQSKGVDQQMEDNCANWLFFSNYKDAVPISQNGRRYCLLFSALQTSMDLLSAGMDKAYFDRLWQWLEERDGYAIMSDWLLDYPIEKNSLPSRAPETSCYAEALKIGRSPLEVLLDNCVERGERGFRNGYVSMTQFLKAIKTTTSMRAPSEHTLETILMHKGYRLLGRTVNPVQGEDLTFGSVIFTNKSYGTLEDYEPSQLF